MPVNLSVKGAPDEMVKRLRDRATRHHRSLQGELMAILEAAAYEEPRELTPRDVLAMIRAAGVSSGPSSTRTIRADRERRIGSRRR